MEVFYEWFRKIDAVAQTLLSILPDNFSTLFEGLQRGNLNLKLGNLVYLPGL